MKISNVVNQLAKIIPQVSPFFSDSLGIVSISGDGVSVSVETDVEHNLGNGEFVNIANIKTENAIASVSFSTVNGQSILAVETSLNHDLTLNPRSAETQFVELVGFTDSAWNGQLELIEVSNRKNFKVANGTASAPVLNGNELLLELILGQFNGPQTVTVVDTTNFTYPSDLIAVGQGGSVATKIRIAGVVNFERALDQYTENLPDKYFMFVVPPTSVTANKSRGTQTDINNEQTQQTYFTENIRDGFILLVIADASTESGALDALDKIRDEVFRSITLAVRGFKFESGLACPVNQVAGFKDHGVLAYNDATLVYQFSFEVPLVMTIEDSVQPETRAFRDIDFVNSVSDNENVPELTASIDLDDEPLP